MPSPLLLLGAAGVAAYLFATRKNAPPPTTPDQANFFGEILNRSLQADYVSNANLRQFSQEEFQNMVFVLSQGSSAIIDGNGQALHDAGYTRTSLVFKNQAENVHNSGR